MIYAQLLFTLNIAIFYGFSIFYFNKKGVKLDWRWTGLQILTGSFWLLSLFDLWTAVPLQDSDLLIFTSFNAMSLALFFWTFKTTASYNFDNIYTDRSPEVIVSHGPYRFISHPYYTSYLMCYLTTLWLPLAPVHGCFVAFLFVMYVIAARDEQKKIMLAQSKGAKNTTEAA